MQASRSQMSLAANVSSELKTSDIPTPDRITTFVPYACGRLAAPFRVHFKTQVEDEYVSTAHHTHKEKKPKPTLDPMRREGSLAVIASRSKQAHTMSVSVPYDSDDTSQIYTLIAKTDTFHRLIEISFTSHLQIPQMLLKIIALCLPYNPHLTKLSYRCGLSGGALYETVKILNTSQITDLSLDGSRVYGRNFYILLDHQTRLQVLSLARCRITDEDCALLIPKFAFPNPAAETIKTLNLSCNFITDEGAHYIAQALRTNRTLLYLNLSGNNIGNTGAIDICSSLMEFAITSEELTLKRQRTFYFLKMRKEMYEKCIKDLSVPILSADDRSGRRKTATPGTLRRKSIILVDNAYSPEVLAAKAEKMTDELVGSFTDPFRAETTYNRNDKVYSGGNLTLCYLNIAYNNVGYRALMKLVEVMRYQSLTGKYPNLGLMSLQLDGNPMPKCLELDQLTEMVARARQVRMVYADPQLARRKKK